VVDTLRPAHQGSYTVLDNALTQTLSNAKALGQIGTWAPRTRRRSPFPFTAAPVKCGRWDAITLSKAAEVVDGLEQAFQRLNKVGN
jgi:hypothetical protein